MIPSQFSEDQLLDALVKKLNDGFSAPRVACGFTLAEARKSKIREALRRTEGNATAAAKLLGISRSTLYRWQSS